MHSVWEYTKEGSDGNTGTKYFLGLNFNSPTAAPSSIMLSVDDLTPPDRVLEILNDIGYGSDSEGKPFNLRFDHARVGTENGIVNYADVLVARKEKPLFLFIGGGEKKTSIVSTAYSSNGETMYNHRIFDTSDMDLVLELSKRCGWPDIKEPIDAEILRQAQYLSEIRLAQSLAGMGSTDDFTRASSSAFL